VFRVSWAVTQLLLIQYLNGGRFVERSFLCQDGWTWSRSFGQGRAETCSLRRMTRCWRR